jgi:hypothetical protein
MPKSCHCNSLKPAIFAHFSQTPDSAQELGDFTAPLHDLPTLWRGESEQLLCTVSHFTMFAACPRECAQSLIPPPFREHEKIPGGVFHHDRL